MYNLSNIQKKNFPIYDAKESFLVVYESGEIIQFDIKRIFIVKSIEKSERGSHAHKTCSQLFVTLSGECKIKCDDGVSKSEFILNKSSEGLLIPPTIWAEQEYQSNTILMVLTNQYYDELDYIRDYSQFLKFRKNI